jgi:hypothetical protein
VRAAIERGAIGFDAVIRPRQSPSWLMPLNHGAKAMALPVIHRIDNLPGGDIPDQLRKGDRIAWPGETLDCHAGSMARHRPRSIRNG